MHTPFLAIRSILCASLQSKNIQNSRSIHHKSPRFVIPARNNTDTKQARFTANYTDNTKQHYLLVLPPHGDNPSLYIPPHLPQKHYYAISLRLVVAFTCPAGAVFGNTCHGRNCTKYKCTHHGYPQGSVAPTLCPLHTLPRLSCGSRRHVSVGYITYYGRVLTFFARSLTCSIAMKIKHTKDAPSRVCAH